MDPSIGIMDDGDLLIDDGKIIAIGQKLGSWAVMEIDGRGMIAMPGLINGHIHDWGRGPCLAQATWNEAISPRSRAN
jgi:5-methylthioadenosine/S-adenosylhomocysteine deaminase